MNSTDNQYQNRTAETGSLTGAGFGAAKRGEGRSEGLRGGRITDRLFTIILVGIMMESRAVMTYAEHVADMQTDEYERFLNSAREYNSALAETGIKWGLTDEEKAAYNEELNIDGSGIMGYIKIQKIQITLPLYHGTDEGILQTSIGHLEGSSLPVGGEGTHCLLSGHRGLPSARLFTDLDQLREGDTFTMTVLNETLTYEVDHIWIVEPEDLSHLQIEEGKDLCTLITCTPYGINTHRLLVRGHRIENADGGAMVTADAIQIRPIFIAPFLAIPILIILLIWVLVTTSVNRRWNRDRKREYLRSHNLREAELEIRDKDLVLEAVRALMEKRK